MRGFYTAQEGHLIHALPPQDITGGAVTDRFSMENYAHVSIIILIGASVAAPTSIILKAADAATSGTETAVGFSYFAELTSAGDTLASKVTVAATGITSVTANDDTMYVIELDDAELPDGSPWVEIEIAAPASEIFCSVVAVLSGARFASDQSATALA